MSIQPIGALAAAVALAACGPRVDPAEPADSPPDRGQVSAPTGSTSTARSPGRQVLVGELCPDRASGRPAVLPLVVRRVGWLQGDEDVTAPIERNEARQFLALGWDGRRVGLLSVAGLSVLGMDQKVATGGYAGTSPCVGPQNEDGQRVTYEACVEAQQHCALAVAVLERSGGMGARPFAEDPEPVDLDTGGACVADGKLVVDIDGDRQPEAYPARAFLGPVREPAEEVTEIARDGTECEPRFASRHLVPPGNPKHFRGGDLLGVVDLDGDGRRELVVSYHYADGRRTWAVYSALDTPARLERVGESMTWRR